MAKNPGYIFSYTTMKPFSQILITLAITTSASFAEPPPPTEPGQHQAASAAEFFKKLDTDGDGSLSLDEFKAGPAGQKNPGMAEEYFKKLDQNGDGKVTLEEFTSRPKSTSLGDHPEKPKTTTPSGTSSVYQPPNYAARYPNARHPYSRYSGPVRPQATTAPFTPSTKAATSPKANPAKSYSAPVKAEKTTKSIAAAPKPKTATQAQHGPSSTVRQPEPNSSTHKKKGSPYAVPASS